MISRLGLVISRAFGKTAPDPFVLAIVLTVVTFAAVLWKTPLGFMQAIDLWAGTKGLWTAGILKFAMQMCLILVTGHALASSPPVSRLLNRLAALPGNAWQGVALVALTAGIMGVFNWGLGLIAGALMARRVGVGLEKRDIAVHYPLLAAAGYIGLLLWHGGFSGSAPLKVANTSEITDIFGSNPPFESISIAQTILSPLNLFITGGLLVLIPIVMAWMMPKEAHNMHTPSSFVDLDEESASHSSQSSTLRTKPFVPRLLEDSPVMTLVLVSFIAIWAWRYYFPPIDPTTKLQPVSGLMHLTPDTVNLTMLMLGLVLHGTPMRYVRAVEKAASSCAGIILQFPLYAGIMGLMSHSGLTAQMAGAMGQHATPATMPLMTLGSAALVNLFVPSGGGQWAIQGPIAMQAAVDTGVAPAKMVMAVAYGDELTNMLQPFWALPLLAITGVKARDIVGYTAIVMVLAAAWMVIGLVVF